MSKQEILQELPKLPASDRGEIWDKIYELEEQELLQGKGIPEEEKVLLDQEWEDYRANPDTGSSWDDVRARLLKTERS